jgi:hypothetical protein
MGAEEAFKKFNDVKLEKCNKAKQSLENKTSVIEAKLVEISISPNYEELSDCLRLLDTYRRALGEVETMISTLENRKELFDGSEHGLNMEPAQAYP